MSLETIYRAVSHAYKTASEASGGTAEEKSALDVLGGLSALLESRVHLHKQAFLTTPGAPPAPPAPATARMPSGAARATPAASSTAPGKPPASGDSGEYELR